MLLAALADGRAVDYLSFLDHYIEDQEGDALSICLPEQARTTLSLPKGSEGASKDPEKVSVRHADSGSSTEKSSRYCRAL
jgi:hypothetical protein